MFSVRRFKSAVFPTLEFPINIILSVVSTGPELRGGGMLSDCVLPIP